jgi:hypothetical protein
MLLFTARLFNTLANQISHMRITFFLLITVILFSCSDPPKKQLSFRDELGGRISKQFGAKSYSIDNGHTNSWSYLLSDYGAFDYKLTNPKSPSDSVPVSDLISGVALTLFNSLPDSVKENHSGYQIDIEDGIEHYNHTYSPDELQQPALMSGAVGAFIHWVQDSTAHVILDRKHFPDSIAVRIRNEFKSRLPGNEKLSYTILNFDQTSLGDYGEETLYSYTVNVSRGTNHFDFVVRVSDRNYLVVYFHEGVISL